MNTFIYIIVLIIFIVFNFLIGNKEFFDNTEKKNDDIQCFTNRLTLIEKECYIDLLKNIDKILTKNNIIWMPSGGNLLALYRHDNLFIPWDDDIDIVIEEGKTRLAINKLKEELPNDITITFYKKIDNGELYRVFYNNNNNKYKEILKDINQNNVSMKYPFVDIFIDNKLSNKVSGSSKCFFPNNILLSEYPLKQKKFYDIKINYPTKGNRNLENFKKFNHIDICYDRGWSHKYSKNIKCKGISKKKCSLIES